jgi:hypothetical protein
VQIGKNKLECFRYGCSKQKVEAQAQKLQGMKSQGAASSGKLISIPKSVLHMPTNKPKTANSLN